ncbi:MAG: Ig-like domain-containing protein [Chloroflexi bacterium]|nr:Ig-like domain-containing protein [Chloroflexota bacterium]
MKRGCLIPLIALLAILLCIVVAITGYVLITAPTSTPLVAINSPRNSERVGVGQETIIHATARGDAQKKIKRVEVWVDGALQDAQSSSLPGGTSPFPIVANWRPTTSGAHTLIVRAFNQDGKHGQASINVQAVQSGDRDNDSVLDALDGCPDQPGLTTNNGCPMPTTGDRDGDGVSDSADVCPDQPGTTLAGGCLDDDGDGIRDGVDACPREPGTAERNGCPAPGDADSDGVADASDACPRDPGRTEAGGCPDHDADGVRDSDDACPDEAGTAGLRGCPDRDGDGVRDTIDLCPDVPGPASNSGCPPTGSGDSDGDGVDNSTDLSPTESGSADSGGAPPPGGGTDADRDGIPESEEAREDPLSGLDLLIPGYLFQFVPVELQALEFQVSHNYTQVYCYATVAGQAAERIGPFSSLGAQRWDIAAFLGPLHSRTFMAPQGQPLQVRLECSGIVAGSRESPGGGGIGEGGGSEAYFDLGSFSRSHTLASSAIDEVTVDSSGGSAGHSFRVKYRVCTPGCKTPVLRAPSITLLHGGGQNRLAWAWAGHSYDINGFKLYMNGNYMFAVSPRSTNYLFRDVPPCGRNFEIQLSAYRGNPHRPDIESPLSNIVTWEGARCPRMAMVSLVRLETGNLRDNDDLGDVGPLFGSFQVGDVSRSFESHYRLDVGSRNHNIAAFFPRTDFTVDLGPDDSLYIGATIKDRDPGLNPNDTIFDWEEIIAPADVRAGERRITGRGGSTLVVQITVTNSR